MPNIAKRKYLTVLEALELDIHVTDPAEGVTYCLSDDGRFGMVLEAPADRMMILDWSLNAIIAFCEKFPDDYIFELKANIALRKHKMSKARVRIAS